MHSHGRNRFGKASWRPQAGFALAALVLGGLSHTTLAEAEAAPQEPPADGQGVDATVVAARVQAFYDQTKNLEADFDQTYVHKLYQRTDRSRGAVTFKKPGKMRWDYAQPNGKLIVSNGKKLWVYEPGEEKEPGQAFVQAVRDADLPQALSFLTGTGRLAEDFNFRLLDATRQGFPTGDVLELRPKQPNPHYERILFYVEKDPRVSGLVRRVLIVDHNGNRNRFDFKNLRFNRQIEEGTFDWQPPKGTRIVRPN